jgi:hypothetical protein
VKRAPRIALLWHEAEDQSKARRARLDGVFRALSARGVMPGPVIYADVNADTTRDLLLGMDGVLVWVNPITAGRDRSVLDTLLREVAAAGVWVSAHPDVIRVLGTKEVLHSTRQLGWGSDVRVYEDREALSVALPSRLASGPVVLKHARGHDGLNVWKVDLERRAEAVTLSTLVRVEHAFDGTAEVTPLGAFLGRFADYFETRARLVEQPFFDRVQEGIVRAYVSGSTVAGFAEHLPRGFVPASEPATRHASGLAYEKRMYGSDATRFAPLRAALESEAVLREPLGGTQLFAAYCSSGRSHCRCRTGTRTPTATSRCVTSTRIAMMMVTMTTCSRPAVPRAGDIRTGTNTRRRSTRTHTSPTSTIDIDPQEGG